MLGMDMLVKQMLGVDPEEIKSSVEDFVTHVRGVLETVDQRQKRIEEGLALILASQLRVETQLEELTIQTRGNLGVSQSLPLQPVTVEQLSEWLQ